MSRKKRVNYTGFSQPEENETISVPAEDAGQDNLLEDEAEEVKVFEEKEEEPEEVEIPLPKKAFRKNGIVSNCTMVNVRKEPNTTSPILCILNVGTEVFVFEEVNGYYEVTTKSEVKGYINKDFLSVK